MKKTLLLTSAITASMVIPVHAEESSSMPNLKILNEFSTGWVRNFNPWFGGRSDFAYESLYIFDILDSENVHPWLAKGYQLSDDLMVLTVDLRDGVLWSDGKPFTADDVVFTYNYPKAHPEIDTGGVSGKVEKVEKVSDLQVKIYLKEPNAFAARDILGETVRIVPKHIWEGVDSPAQSTNENPVGTGPFTEIQRFTPQVYVQCRNPNYWNKDLKIDCLEFPQFSSNDAALEMLSKGSVDWAGIFIPDIERTFVSKHPNNKYWFPSNDGVRITFNYKTENEGANKAFHDVNFRKAVSLSMDREAMMMIGSYGYVVGGNPATNLPKGMWNWRDEQADKTWAEFNRYDINKAKQLLAEGGYKDTTGDGFVENPDGSKLTFKIQVPSGWSDWVNNTSIAVEGLRMAGIDATVITPEANGYAKNWESANFDATFGAGSMQSSVWKFYDFTMGSEYVQSPVWWSTTVSNYVDPQLDQWISELGLTKDEDQQKKIAANVERYFAENVIQIPLYYNGIWYAYNDSRFEGWANEENQIGHPAPWNGMSRLVHLMNLKPKG